MEKERNSLHDGPCHYHDEEKKKGKALAFSDGSETRAHGEDDSETETVRSVDFSSTEMADFCAAHNNSLFAKVLYKKVGHQKLSTHLNRLWSPKDFNKAIEGAPWLIDGHCIVFLPWVPNFKPSEVVITKAKVWVRLPELPVEFYNDLALSRIAEAIGINLIKLDPFTARKLKCKFARLCIEIDLNRPVVPCIKLGQGLWQTIQYEGLPVLCYQCGRVGHLHPKCLYFPASTSKAISVPHEAPTTLHNIQSVEYCSVYGPWLQVPRRQRLWPHRLANESGRQQVWVPSAGNFEQQNLLCLTDELNSPKEKSATIPVSVSSSLTKMINTEPPLEQNRHLQPGEGTSSPVNNIETFIQNDDAPAPLDSKQFSTAEEAAATIFSGTPLKVEVPEHFTFFTVPVTHLPHDSVQPHQANSPYVSSRFPKSNVLPSLTLDSPSAPFFSPRSHSTSHQRIDDQFFTQVVQLSTKVLEVNNAPVEVIERSTEGGPTVVIFESNILESDIDVNISPLSTGHGNQHHTRVKPTVIDHSNHHGACKNKVLIWNCRGAGDPKVEHMIKALCQEHKPAIVLLLETRTTGFEADRVIRGTGFSSSYRVDPVGFSGGTWLLWSEEHVQIDVRSTAQQIHATVEFLPQPHELMLHEVDGVTEFGEWVFY
ncbi:hypothetical protein F0562_014450 [Nyssa sinensis]|uniref:CCHC-type domain-containing protein n=1 Tax=Nyssa sinensis TaxID=561372 RepID=A0A5J4ZQP0_9ASTE|nr:hypothetical protein F0562_014450 [Nyssa sinensis]